MAKYISGEQFVRQSRRFLEANEGRLLSKDTKKEEPTLQPTTNGGFFRAITSLWSNNDAALQVITTTTTTTTQPEMPISNVPYINPNSTLILDIHYLYFFLVQFDYLGLENASLPVPEENGLVEAEVTASDTPSITSVGSKMSNLSLSNGWRQWSSPQTSRPLHEDIAYIHKYFGKLHSLKIYLPIERKRIVKGYKDLCSVPLPLSCFKNLTCLELCNVSPRNIESWSFLQQRLTNLVIRSSQVDNMTNVITAKWPLLKRLLVEDNNLTTLDTEPLQLIDTVTHLNVSKNLLIDVPSGLASLYNLVSLNLSYNMISYTTGINTVLGNIHELDLRGNRLTVLAGLDKLWALEKLDIRDNRIEDAAEVGRLTSLPNISHIWVEGNPFTMVQSDYRVEIFNMFHQHDLDITLDASKPSFAERRRIQIPSTPTPPTISAKIVTDATSPTRLSRTKTKTSKRQVRLGQIKQDMIVPVAADIEDSDTKYVHRLSGLEESVQQEQAQLRKATSLKSRRSSKSGKKSISAEEKAATSHVDTPTSHNFRKKIEAMRREAGTEWLRVLQEMDVVKKGAINQQNEQ